MKCHSDGTELLQVILSQVELLTGTDDFYRLYGFTLQHYLSNRGSSRKFDENLLLEEPLTCRTSLLQGWQAADGW